MNDIAPLLSVRHISRSFGPVQVISDVSFDLSPGTVTGLVGENGAGKSTIIGMLAGALPPTSGEILFESEPLPTNTKSAIQAGISVIYQELTDVSDMSLMENVLLGQMDASLGIIQRGKARLRAKAALTRVGLEHVDTSTPIRSLTIAQRQLAEIARCLTRNVKVLILDEPTSALPEQDVETLLGVVRELQAQGLAILYVSHHLDELFAITDRLLVLRDGHLIADRPTDEWDEASLVRAMLAKELSDAYPWKDRNHGDVVLEAEDLIAPGVKRASIRVRRNEIVGLVGLAGSGRTELMKALSGVTRASSGVVTVHGRVVSQGSIRSAHRSGVVYAPEDRKREGLVLDATIQANLAYGAYREIAKLGFLQPQKIRERADASMKRFGIKANSSRQPVGELSGGNQQKTVIARVANANPRIALFDDPTRGVDVGAKSGIWSHIFSLAENGAAVIVSSSDTDEVLAVADRVYVLHGGRVVGELMRGNFDREKILHLASSGSSSQEGQL